LSSVQDESGRVAAVFASVPLFKGFGKDELKTIANSSKGVTFKPGEVIVKAGDAGLGFYVLIDGSALVKRRGKTVAKLGRGSFFGEMALFDNQPRSADVIANDATECRVLLRWNFWSLIGKNKRMVQELLQEMARRLRATDEALSE
jgi:CRP/FNR family transcriptional regulator, cyclic AMP receptor protein